MSHRALGRQFEFVKADPRSMGGSPFHTVRAHEPDGDPINPLGSLLWSAKTGELHNINVRSDARRQGVATDMWNEAKRVAEQTRGVRRPRHSPERTTLGEAWARSLGERLPRLM